MVQAASTGEEALRRQEALDRRADRIEETFTRWEARAAKQFEEIQLLRAQIVAQQTDARMVTARHAEAIVELNQQIGELHRENAEQREWQMNANRRMDETDAALAAAVALIADDGEKEKIAGMVKTPRPNGRSKASTDGAKQ